VCATQGSYFNRTVQERYLLQLQLYNSARDAKLAVKDGRCIGYLFDNTALMNDVAQPEWKGYRLLEPATLETPWAMAIARSEHGTDFEKFLSETVADWHRTGFLIEREKAWNIAPSRFVAASQDLWRRKEAGGAYCSWDAKGMLRAECRNKVFLTSTDLSGLARVGLWIEERAGVNLSLIFDAYDRVQFAMGLLTTLLLTAACLAGSLAVGCAMALAAESRRRVVAAAARTVGAVARMTPPLLVMYLVLFGIGSLLAARFGISLSGFAVAVGCLSVYTGAGVMSSLLEAAQALRHHEPSFRLRLASLRRVAPLARASTTAALVNVAKATMMASAVAVPELLSAATSIINERGNVGVMMNALLLTFLLLIFLLVRLLERAERAVLKEVPR
jgi:polar amino acid transport system substrate-binding protein